MVQIVFLRRQSQDQFNKLSNLKVFLNQFRKFHHFIPIDFFQYNGILVAAFKIFAKSQLIVYCFISLHYYTYKETNIPLRHSLCKLLVTFPQIVPIPRDIPKLLFLAKLSPNHVHHIRVLMNIGIQTTYSRRQAECHIQVIYRQNERILYQISKLLPCNFITTWQA